MFFERASTYDSERESSFANAGQILTQLLAGQVYVMGGDARHVVGCHVNTRQPPTIIRYPGSFLPDALMPWQAAQGGVVLLSGCFVFRRLDEQLEGSQQIKTDQQD